MKGPAQEVPVNRHSYRLAGNFRTCQNKLYDLLFAFSFGPNDDLAIEVQRDGSVFIGCTRQPLQGLCQKLGIAEVNVTMSDGSFRFGNDAAGIRIAAFLVDGQTQRPGSSPDDDV